MQVHIGSRRRGLRGCFTTGILGATVALVSAGVLPVAGAAASAAVPIQSAWQLEPGVAIDAGGIDNAVLSWVGCSSPGNCVAIGLASDPSPSTLGSELVATQEIGGVWQPVSAVPSGLGLSDAITIGGLACDDSGGCVAVGTDLPITDGTATGPEVPWEMTGSGGTWGAAQTMGAPATFSGAGYSVVGVSCGSAGLCAAVGNYTDPSSGQVSTMAAVGGTSGLGGFSSVYVGGSARTVACSTNGTACALAGFDVNGFREIFTQTFDGSSWSAPADITSGPGYASDGYDAGSMACPSDGNCVIAGDSPTASIGQALTTFAISETDGLWGATTTFDSGGVVEGPFQWGGMSCESPGNCLVAADGGYNGAFTQGVVAEEAGGTWTGFQADPRPSGAAAPVQFPSGATGVACETTGCDLAGFYSDSTSGAVLPYALSAVLVPVSSTSVVCTQLTDGTTNYGCTATVTDSSGDDPPVTPAGTVSFNAQGAAAGTFPTGTSCGLVATSVAGQSSCSIQYDPALEEYGFAVFMYGDYSGGNLAVSQGHQVFFPQCNQDPVETDGTWQFGGCFTNPDTSDYDTNQTSTADGLTVTPSDTYDAVDYSESGQTLSSNEPTSLAVDVSNITGTPGTLVTLNQAIGTISFSGGPVTVALPSAINFLGLGLSGSITFTPQAGGTAVGTVTGKLPGVLGGQPATVTITTTQGKGVTSVVAQAAAGSLANVIGLDTIKLSYTSGGWTVNATATGAGGATQTLTGTLAYDPRTGKPTGGSLTIGNVVIAGLLNVKTFQVSYSAKTGWTGAADLSQGTQAASVSLAFGADGNMKSGSITASGITLWQVFQLKSFAMTYDAAKKEWGLAMSIAGPGGTSSAVSSELHVRSGTVTGASLELKNVSMLGKVTLNDLMLSYSTPKGVDVFKGKTSLELPGTVVSGVEGSFEMDNGLFVAGDLILHGNVPLYGALYLNTIGAGIQLAPQKVITGHVGLSAGPKTAKGALLGLDNGNLSYTFPTQAGQGGVYTFSGDLVALTKTLGQGTITANNGVAKLSLTLGKNGQGFTVGSRFSANGTITGGITKNSFFASGTVNFSFKLSGTTYSTSGKLQADGNGITACGSVPSLTGSSDSGVTYYWDGSIRTYDGGCPF